MKLLENKQYLSVLNKVIDSFPFWEKLDGKTVLITGATGMIGSFLIDTIMLRNNTLSEEKRCRIMAVGRNYCMAEERFDAWWKRAEFCFWGHDVTKAFDKLPYLPDYLIHGASTTHPKAYATEPVNTILANILGTKNTMDVAFQKLESRFLLLSSVEVYGENRGDVERFKEDYCGYINCNTLRAGYPEGKRVSEAMCQAYIQEKHVNATIVRLPRSYGPTMKSTDTKAIAQFIKKGVSREDIVLKSKGTQLYSYLHTADAVLAIMWVLLRGENGEVYNAGDEKSEVTLRDLAGIIAEHVDTRVVFELPNEIEKKGYSTATKALMEASKLRELGWDPLYDIRSGVCETIDILSVTDSNP